MQILTKLLVPSAPATSIMIHPRLAAFLVVPILSASADALPGAALFGPSPAVARAQAGSDIEGLVDEEVGRASARSVDELWARALELREAELLGGDGELDRVLDSRLASETLDPSARILLAACRLQGEDVDARMLSEVLRPLVDSGQEEFSEAAATLFGNRAFKGLDKKRRKALVEDLLKIAEDASRRPETRLAHAQSAYQIGAGAARRRSDKVLRSFLESEDPELRAEGALAIAQSTDREIEGALRKELRRLAQVPDERGQLARAFLELEDERAYSESKLREIRSRYEESNELPPELDEFVTVLNLVSQRHLEGGRVDREELVHAAVDGMLSWMDRHSSYLPSKVYSKFMQDLEAEYGGIGAYVNEDPDTGLFTIVRPIYSGPAYEAGLMTDDKIVRIGSWPTLGKTEDEIIKRLKGPPGTPVDLYVWRRGMDGELIDRPTDDMKVTVVREQIEIPAGSHQMLPGGIGLLELQTFSQKSMEQLREWIPQMIDDGMKAIVLDMRRNSGGLLTEAREVADLFLPRGEVVVRTEGREREPEALRTTTAPLIPEDMPVVVLTGRMTASAAEIVSGALQDHGRAQLVGKTTFGKGSVQQLLPILTEREDRFEDRNGNRRWDEGEPIPQDHDGDGEMDYAPRVKLTIARYLLPSGRSIHRELNREGELISEGGVIPDHEVELPLIERWRFDEFQRIRKSDVLSEYLDQVYPENRELFGRLAVNDSLDPDQYPRFDELMLDLDTSLSRNDVRRLVRESVRRRVQDDLGQEFPLGDYVEDPQLQKAIEVALAELGEDVDDVLEYGIVFDFQRNQDSRSQEDVALVSPDSARSLRRARVLLEEAQAGGAVLTDESLEELLNLIGELEGEEH